MSEKVVSINVGKRRKSQRLAGARYIAALHPADPGLERNDEKPAATSTLWSDFLERYQAARPNRFPNYTELSDLNRVTEQYLAAGQSVPERIMAYALKLVEPASAEGLLFKYDVIIGQLERVKTGELPRELIDCLVGELVGLHDMPDDYQRLVWQDRYEHYLPEQSYPSILDQS